MSRSVLVTVALLAALTPLRAQTTGRTHRLMPSPRTVAWGFYDAAATPVLRIASGDVVVVGTLITSSPERLEGAGVAPAAAGMASAGSRAAAPREGWLTTGDSTRIYYRVVGRGADTLIAIHGGPGVDLESIAGDFAPLAARHAVVFYDQRGAGRSTLPTDTTRLTAARQVDDLDAVRRHFGLRRVTLVAHS